MPDEPAFAHTETTASAETPAGDEASQTRATTVQKVETPPPTHLWDVQAVLAIVVVVMAMGFLFYIAVFKVWDREVTLMVVPTIAAALMLVLNYFYGSSIGSARKSEQIAKMPLTNGGTH